MYCRVQVPGRPSVEARRARVTVPLPRSTEMAGVGSAAVGTPRPKAEVVPGPGNPGGIQDRLCGRGEGLAAVPHSERAISLGQPKVVDDYLAEKCSTGRVAGPLQPDLFPQVHPNQFGVIPRAGQGSGG